jgi:DNA anti-recombination protein RmuC
MAESMLRKPVNDRKDVYLFIACLVVGFVGIVALKFWIEASQFWVTAFPCAVLAFYLAYVGFTKRYQLRGDRAGDSVYYLGFLYTLLSLGLSLYQFVFEGMTAREIVGNLGIALFTTILGLSGRVVLTQLREDPVEVEESARMALAQAAGEVRAELAHMVEDVAVFRRMTLQNIVEGTEEVARETNKALTENVSAFTTSARKVIERIEEVFGDFGENAKKLNRVQSATITALSKLMTRVEAIDAPATLISHKFDPLADRIKEIFDHFEARTKEQQAAVDKMRTAFEVSTAQVSRSMENVGSIAATAGKLVENMDSQMQAVAESASAVRTLSLEVERVLTDAANSQASITNIAANDLSQVLKEIAQDLKTSLAAVVDTQEKSSAMLLEGASSLIQSVATFENGTKAMAEHSRTQSEEAGHLLRERLNGIGHQAKETIEAQAARIAEVAQQLNDQVVSLQTKLITPEVPQGRATHS